MNILHKVYFSGFIKLCCGALMVLSLLLAVIYLPVPDGIVGEVIRNNLDKQIDASPLFYSEVDSIFEMEKAVAVMHALAKTKRNVGYKK